MKTLEFIVNELKAAAIGEVKNTYPPNEQPMLIDEIIQAFDSDFPDVKTLANHNKIIGSLKIIRYILNLMDQDDGTIQDLEQKLINEPRNKLYQLLWIEQKVEAFQYDEYLDSEYATFLETITASYGCFFELDDFITSTEIILYEQLANTQEYEMFQKVFLKASAMYPNKHPFKKMLARLYFKNNDYFPALECIEQLIHDKHTPGCECDFEEQLDAIQLAGIINYKLGNIERAMIQINYVIDNIPKWEDNNKKVSNKLSFIDAYLYRMRYNIGKGNASQVMDDFNQVEMELFYSDWEHTHPDVFDFINKKIAKNNITCHGKKA